MPRDSKQSGLDSLGRLKSRSKVDEFPVVQNYLILRMGENRRQALNFFQANRFCSTKMTFIMCLDQGSGFIVLNFCAGRG